MRITKVIFFLFLALYSFDSVAQNVGYLGKKFSLDLGAQVTPSFTNLILDPPSSVKDSLTGKRVFYKPMAIRIYPEINISRTLSRNWDISLRFCYQTYKLYYNSVDVIPKNSISYYSYNLNSFLMKDGMNVEAKSSLYEINFRYNLKKFIAPIGTYFNFGFGMYRSKLDKPSVINGGYYYEYFDYGYNPKYQLIQSKDLKNEVLNMKRISLGLHVKRIFTRSFYYDLGVETSVLFGKQYKQVHYGELTERQLEKTFIADLQRKYLLYENLLSLKVAVGLVF